MLEKPSMRAYRYWLCQRRTIVPIFRAPRHRASARYERNVELPDCHGGLAPTFPDTAYSQCSA
jgi:hypothetical protein